MDAVAFDRGDERDLKMALLLRDVVGLSCTRRSPTRWRSRSPPSNGGSTGPASKPSSRWPATESPSARRKACAKPKPRASSASTGIVADPVREISCALGRGRAGRHRLHRRRILARAIRSAAVASGKHDATDDDDERSCGGSERPGSPSRTGPRHRGVVAGNWTVAASGAKVASSRASSSDAGRAEGSGDRQWRMISSSRPAARARSPAGSGRGRCVS